MKLTRLFQLTGFIIFIAVVESTGLGRIASIFANLNPFYLFLSILLTLAVMVFKGLKWKIVIRLHGIDYPLVKSIKVWAIGLFAGMITPGRAGDIIRSLYLSRDRSGLGRSISTVVVDRVTDVLVILGFAIFGMFFFTQLFFSASYVSILSIVILCYAILIYTATRKELTRRLLRPLFKRMTPSRYRKSVCSGFHEFHSSLTVALSKRSGLLLVIALTASVWLFSIVAIQMIAFTVGLEADYFFLLAVMSLTVIVELVPISISGIGTREAFLIFSMGLVGIQAESAITFSILYLFNYWVNGIIGLIFWLRDPIKIDI